MSCFPIQCASRLVSQGDYIKAIHILGEQGWLDKLIHLARSLSASQTVELQAPTLTMGRAGEARRGEGRRRKKRVVL